MTFPTDESKIASSKITFEWDLEEGEKLYYIFVKNVITKEILKIETNGSHLALYDDNPIVDEFIKSLKQKVDLSREGKAVTYDTKGVELLGQDINENFSYQLVVNNSHSEKPLIYKIAGAWGNHEGSLLLWILVLIISSVTSADFCCMAMVVLRACNATNTCPSNKSCCNCKLALALYFVPNFTGI